MKLIWSKPVIKATLSIQATLGGMTEGAFDMTMAAMPSMGS